MRSEPLQVIQQFVLPEGLKQDGKLITIELNDELTAFSHSYFCRAGVESKITQLTGRAQDIIPSLDQIVRPCLY